MIEAIKEWEKINGQQREYIKVIKGDIESLKESYKIAHEYNEVADKEIERLKNQLQQKENIIKEVREKLNTQLAFTSSYQLNYQSAMSIIEEAKQILDKEVN